MPRPFKPEERSIHALTIGDFDATPVWDTEQWDVPGGVDTTVVPLPGRNHLDGLERCPWIRVRGTLADGTPIEGIANVGLKPPQIKAPALFLDGRWHGFFLPPAPDFVLAKSGPAALAARLNRPVDAVFPITLSSEVPYPRGGPLIRTVFETLGARSA